jgi:hypothetical protein
VEEHHHHARQGLAFLMQSQRHIFLPNNYIAEGAADTTKTP